MQLQYVQRSRAGLSMQAGYTWSSNVDTGSEATFVGGGDHNATVSELESARSMRGPSRLSQPHRFTVFLGYDLNGDGVTNDRPFLVDTSILGRSVDNGRVNPATGLKFSQGQLPNTAFWPTADIAATKLWPWYPGSKIAGSLGRNTFRMHGQNEWNMAFIKNVRLYGEHHHVQFRAEMFNLMNRVQFGMPAFLSIVDTGVAGWRLQPRFGEITGTQNSSRSMQMSLRYWF